MSVRSINHLEHGRRRPYPRTACLLADGLGLVGRRRTELVDAARGRPVGDERRRSATARAARPAAGWDDRVVPRQLTTAVRGFAGRARELAVLDRLASDLGDGGPAVGVDDVADAARSVGTAAIGVISGMPGVGKTALVLHWAHRVAGRFPDGQLYLDLRGFSHDSAPMAPGEAIDGLLAALGVSADRLPEDVAARAAVYRSAVANRRMLIVLDNASDAQQVRPLLPGGSRTMVVVTSRDRLASLLAVEGARPIGLDVLDIGDARALLTDRIGRERAAAEPDAVGELVEQCARLPLALAVVAAVVQTCPARSLARAAEELRADGRRLAALSVGDAAADVRAVFSWSYRRLDPAAARVFRLLGIAPGPSVDRPTAVALTGLTPHGLEAVVARLSQAHLVEQDDRGSLLLNDLLREYATELAALHGEGGGEGEGGVGRSGEQRRAPATRRALAPEWPLYRPSGERDRGGRAVVDDSPGHPSARPAVRSPSSPPVTSRVCVAAPRLRSGTGPAGSAGLAGVPGVRSGPR